MILRINDLYNNTLNYDICIIGGGPAGITIAYKLMSSKFKVLLVESGSLVYKNENQLLSAGINEDFGEYPFPSYSLIGARVRAFGGSSLVWRGWSAPLQEIDFKERPWVPNSGWPIDLYELSRYYEESQDICDLGPFIYNADLLECYKHKPELIDDKLFKLNYWQFPLAHPTRFGEKYYNDLKNSENVIVILNANCCDIVTNESNNTVERIIVSSLDNRKIDVIAKYFVLATGGIENTRLILNHEKKYGKKLGNHANIVGSYFMEHPHCVCADFYPNDNFIRNFSYYIKKHIFAGPAISVDNKNFRVGTGLSLKEQFQEKYKTLNSCITFNINRVLELPSLISLFYFLQAKNIPISKVRLLQMLISELPHAIREACRTFLFNPKISKPRLFLYSRSEQSPDINSKVSLVEEKDSLGLNKVKLNWRMSAFDKNSILKTVNILSSLIQERNLGKVIIKEWLLESSNDEWPSYKDKKFILGIGHHMGTTRMSNNKIDGVVDRNCKMYGVSNLFVAGSSVFPSGGYANPTLTIVALSLRIAEYITENFGKSG